MKKIALLIVFTISIAGYSQSLDCSKFKNGKFFNPNFPSSSFVIKDTIMEDYNNDVVVFTWDLKWLNDCEYEAVCTKSMDGFITVGNKMIISITAIDDECFAFDRTLLDKKFSNGLDKISFYSCIEKIK